MENKPNNPVLKGAHEINNAFTLLDYFAAKALPSIIHNEMMSYKDIEGKVHAAYLAATAMLKEREKHL